MTFYHNATGTIEKTKESISSHTVNHDPLHVAANEQAKDAVNKAVDYLQSEGATHVNASISGHSYHDSVDPKSKGFTFTVSVSSYAPEEAQENGKTET